MSAPVNQRTNNFTDMLAAALNQLGPTSIGSTKLLPQFIQVKETVGESDSSPNFKDAVATGAFFISYKDANAVSLMGSPTWVAGKYGYALQFNGSTQYSTVADNPALEIAGPWTVACWVKPLALPSTTAALVIKGILDANENYHLALTSAGKVEVGFADGTTRHTATGATVLSVGTWYHLVGWYDKVNLKLYVNGNLDAIAANTSTPHTNTSTLTLAAVAGGSSYANVVLDEIRVMNAAISDGGVTTVGNSAKGMVGGLYGHAPNANFLDVFEGPLVCYLPFDENSGTPSDYSGTFTAGYSDFAA